MPLSSVAQILIPPSLHEKLQSSSIAKRLVRGSLWSMFGSAISRILILIAMILVARILGKISFGEFGIIQATLGVVGLMAGVSLGSTATRFVAQYAVSDPGRAGRVIALVMSVSIGTVLLGTVILIAASDFVTQIVLDAPHLQSVLVLGSLLMVATALRGIQSGVFAGLEKFDHIAKLNILDGVVSLVAMVLLANVMGVEGAVLGLTLGAVVAWLVGRVWLRGVLRIIDIDVCYKGCWADWRILTRYSLPSLLSSLVATPVLWFCMTLVARTPNGYAELGLYNAAYQWHGPIMFIPMILMSVSIPILVQEWEAGRRKRFRKITFGICGLMFAISLPLASMVAFLSPWVMSLYGPGFQEGWLVLVLLLAAVPFHALAKIASGALLGMNRAWWVLGVNLFWGMILLILTVWLVPDQGVIGLAIAFLTAYAVLSVLSLSAVLLGSKLCS